MNSKMTLNLGQLELDDPEGIAEILFALKAAGLQITNIQIKGDQQQTQQFFDRLSYLATVKKRQQRQVLTSLLPAAVGSLTFVLVGVWLWI